MNTTTLKGNWNVTKGKLKQQWASLTDDDLMYIEGRENEMIGRIQKRTGATTDVVKRFIDKANAELNR